MNESEARVMKQNSPLFQRRMFQEFGMGTTPALRATPPNLGGEFWNVIPRLKTL